MRNNPTTSNAPKARAGVETYIVPDGSCFLYDPASDATYTLDQLGALVWDYCDGRTPADQIIQEVAALLPDDAGLPARVRRALAEFAGAGLLAPAHPGIEAGDD